MADKTGFEVVSDYRFRPADLDVGSRRPGISAFMRIRNGADFLEVTIRSHIAHFDEIVAVYNRTTDATPQILARLRAEFGPKLRVFHYLPPVFPPGSTGHASEPADSPRSMVNYSNFALAQTRHAIAVKLDDDHLARGDALAGTVRRVRTGAEIERTMLCFSGINLARDDRGTLGVLGRVPFTGAGDHGFFRVSPETRFIHDRRFEHFQTAGLKRAFAGITYWHLKHLKPGFGFENADIASGSNPRFQRKLQRFLDDRRVTSATKLGDMSPAYVPLLALLPLPEKQRLVVDRWLEIRGHPIRAAEFAAVVRLLPEDSHAAP